MGYVPIAAYVLAVLYGGAGDDGMSVAWLLANDGLCVHYWILVNDGNM